MVPSSTDRTTLIQQIFDQVVALNAEERTAHLDQACADDPDLRHEVEALLAVENHVDDLFRMVDLHHLRARDHLGC